MPSSARECAVDEARLDQECRHVLRHARLDHLPARPDHDQRHQAVQDHEQHRDAVDAEEVEDVVADDPLAVLDELHVGAARREMEPKRQRDQEPERRSDQRDPAGEPRVLVTAHREHGDTCDDRAPRWRARGRASRSLSGLLSRMRRRRVGRSSRRAPEGIPAIWRGRVTRKCARVAPSLRAAAIKRVCVVARLANTPDIRGASRLASIPFWPCNAYVTVSPTGSLLSGSPTSRAARRGPRSCRRRSGRRSPTADTA